MKDWTRLKHVIKVDAVLSGLQFTTARGNFSDN